MAHCRQGRRPRAYLFRCELRVRALPALCSSGPVYDYRARHPFAGPQGTGRIFVRAQWQKSRRPVQVLGQFALGRSQFGQMRELELIPKFTGKSPSSAACAHPGSAASRRSVGGFLEGGGTAGGREKVEAGGVTRRLRYHSRHFERKRWPKQEIPFVSQRFLPRAKVAIKCRALRCSA